MKRKLLPLALYSLALISAFAIIPPVVTGQEKISAADAAKHVGQKATVCGTVASAAYASRVK